MSDEENLNRGPAVNRPDGVTDAERYLKRLCDRTFLSLWSYPGIFRDQGQTATSREGKEVCDLLVVFDRHIIIFSDKDSEFPRSGNPVLDWSRWFRRAVLSSAKQVWGAERWIKSYPHRLFLDRGCSRPFPIELPDPATAKFHRVLVAHAASPRCREALGGSGSLMIVPSIGGPMHYEGADVRPFSIGQIDPSKGYIHVFDDTSLNVVLQTLDTITDFVRYLTKKEQLIESGRLIWAAGEDDLLAYYLRNLNDQGEHDIVIPDGYHGITIEEGLWEWFQEEPRRRAQLKADAVSYVWDGMIERFARAMLAGTGLSSPHAGIRELEKIVRMMAAEPRLRRRMLAEAFVGLLKKTPHDRPIRAARVVAPSCPSEPCYVFLLLTGPEGELPDQYRLARVKLLNMYCMVVKLDLPDALDIVGYATEPGSQTGHSEIAVYHDMRTWTAEDQAEAQRFRDELGLLSRVQRFRHNCQEYPTLSRPRDRVQTHSSGRQPRSMRNSPCPCGSGRKFKQCCLRRSRR